ncbi:uncharacterized protein LOC128982421 [Macrosteles quadrilineatus]|uniref:uncharacterized protein LOC128982421 n=1 Tax=Macrosteles quadrilineatus TaxID=74068 RepID=UPI0023E104D8|nr:uncharacterized protein LOC128982421 [Macrosteles quadrilineatus]XP_054257353.1 uncharacterized protein LOC128982421 [Macrosteles quadrilineatus]
MANQWTYHIDDSVSADPSKSSMLPWMSSSMSWTMENPPQLVRFGEPRLPEMSFLHQKSQEIPRPRTFCVKRKYNFDFCPNPAKMHITEEKMAAQLKNMHISNNYVGEKSFADGLENSDCALPTLVLSKEVQSLTQSLQQPLLPESLFPKRDPPTKALVLWKPPVGNIPSQIMSSIRSSDEDNEVDNMNNNSSTPDLNTMITPEFSSSNTEMEL